MISAERLREILSYNPDTGVFSWKENRGSAKAGDIAGSLRKDGYLYISVDGFRVGVHRLVFLYTNNELPNNDVDHLNGIRSDNRQVNLRLASRAMNTQNIRSPSSRNKTGFLGVVRHRNRYKAVIYAGKYIHIGVFDTAVLAHNAYLKAKRKLHKGCTI